VFECDELSYIASEIPPSFCPICGRRAEAQEVEE
jgi:rubrerythrin